MSGTSIIAQIFVPLKGGCRGSYESTNVKMPHCWKSHAAAQIILLRYISVQFYTVTSLKESVNGLISVIIFK